MSRTPIGLLVAATALACAPSAHAAGWVTGAALSPASAGIGSPQVALLPDGGRVAAWIQEGGDGFSPENVSVRVAPPTGDFGPAQTFPGEPAVLRMATGTDGTVALTWSEFTSRTVHIARRAPGEPTFTEVAPLTVPSNETPGPPEVVVSGGDVFTAFESGAQSGPRTRSVWAARLARDDDGILIMPGRTAIGALEHGDNPNGSAQLFFGDVGITADGPRVTVAWAREHVDADGQHSQTFVRLADRALSNNSYRTPITIDTTASNGSFPPDMTPAIAAGGGHTYVLWARRGEDNVLFRDIAGAGATQTIRGSGGFGARDLRAAVDGSGALVAAWEAAPRGIDNDSLFSALVPAGTAPGAAVPLTPVGIDRRLGDLAVAADGTALALPIRSTFGIDESFRVEAALRPAGKEFAAAESVSGLQDDSPNAGFEPASAAVAVGGRAVAVWAASEHTGAVNQRLFFAERDTTPPLLTSIDVPLSAVAGDRVALSASATDDLSAPAVTWDFGDGSQARGANVTHVFGSAGATTVTVTARDSVGQTTSQTRAVAVMPAPLRADDGGGGEGAGNAGGSPPQDATQPVLTRLTVSNRRFRVGRVATAVIAAKTKAARAGTVLRFGLSERATLAVEIARKAKGKRLKPAGTLVRANAQGGANAIAFSGRIGKTALAPGDYVATLTAIDGAGNRSAPATVAFSIVRK
jgi:hypothetical protein